MKIAHHRDDGVTTDVRLVSLLRRHGARATFNLNASLHAPERRFGWRHRDTEVWRLGLSELRSHACARTTRDAEAGVETRDAMAAAPSCHFLAPDCQQRLERARPAGALWFRGHSYELVDEAMWTAFEATLARLCAEPDMKWCDPTDLFDGDRR
jgi:peptidoglycan/xylan/chitin deacetylase (PgdA/CDA1 family)